MSVCLIIVVSSIQSETEYVFGIESQIGGTEDIDITQGDGSDSETDESADNVAPAAVIAVHTTPSVDVGTTTLAHVIVQV